MTWSVVWRLGVTGSLCLALSRCFLNALLPRITVTSLDEERRLTDVALQASGTIAVCSEIFAGEPVECIYYVNGEPIASTLFLTSEFGLLGALIDPLILQVPIAATNFTGTFSGTSTSGNLDITVVSGSLDADVNTTIAPEPGHKLVIVDFPASASSPGGAYGFTFGFQLPGVVNPVQVKALFAGRVQSGGRTFYPPLLPCESRFANIPAIALPASATFQPVDVGSVAGLAGCGGRVYRLSAAAAASVADIPALHPALLGVLAALVGWAGVRFTRSR